MTITAFIENNVITKWPVSFQDIQKKHPNTSFNDNWRNCDLTSFGIVQIEDTVQPTIDYKTHKITEGTPTFSDNKWKRVWNVIALSTDEQNKIKESTLFSLRATRDELLKECDWTQTADSPLSSDKKTEWATYRQALRDVPAQSDVYNITWPTKPS